MRSVATARVAMSASTILHTGKIFLWVWSRIHKLHQCVRFSRPRRLKEYIDWVQKLHDGMVGHDATSVGSKDMAMDVVMLSLRTARGLDLSSFGRSFGDCLAFSLCKALGPFVESGHVVAIDGDRKSLSFQDFEQQLNDDYEIGNKVALIRLSDPDGFLLSNELISIAFGVISP